MHCRFRPLVILGCFLSSQLCMEFIFAYFRLFSRFGWDHYKQLLICTKDNAKTLHSLSNLIGHCLANAWTWIVTHQLMTALNNSLLYCSNLGGIHVAMTSQQLSNEMISGLIQHYSSGHVSGWCSCFFGRSSSTWPSCNLYGYTRGFMVYWALSDYELR